MIKNDKMAYKTNGHVYFDVKKSSKYTELSGRSFEDMFSNDNFHKLPRVKGKVFLDREPEIFKMIVIFLRSGQKLPHIEDNFKRHLFE